MSDIVTRQNAYENMLSVVTKATFIKLDDKSDWLRIDAVDDISPCNDPGDIAVHVRNDYIIGNGESTIVISDIDPNKVKFLMLHEYNFSGALMSVTKDESL